jgi:hypothetical protein
VQEILEKRLEEEYRKMGLIDWMIQIKIDDNNY